MLERDIWWSIILNLINFRELLQRTWIYRLSRVLRFRNDQFAYGNGFDDPAA